MRLDRLLGQMQDLGDLLVGVRLGDQLEHLLLARRQRLVGALGGVGHPVADQRPLDGVGQERLAAVHGADRLEQVLVDLALEHVARRARLERLEHVALVVVHRQHEHLRRRAGGPGSRAPPAGPSCAASTRRGRTGPAGRSACSTASAPSAASATTSMSGWRSSSSLSPPRTMPWSSAIRILMSLPSSARWWSPRPARRRRPGSRRRAARARACRSGRARRRRDAPFRARRRAFEAAAVVGTRSTVRPTNDSSTSTSRAPRVLGDVRQALLRDAVDHELLLVGQRRHARRGGGSAPAMPVRWPKSLDLAGERGDQAVVVERGRAQLAGEREQLLHRLADELLRLLQLARRPHGASPIVAESRSRIAVSAWLTSSCRSCAIRLRSCSCARSTARPARGARPRAGRACG